MRYAQTFRKFADVKKFSLLFNKLLLFNPNSDEILINPAK